MPDESLKRARQKAAERILEDERLYSHLTGDEARWLVDWAMEQLAAPLPKVRNQSQAEALIELRSRRVRQIVRDINDLIGERGRLSLSEREARLRILLSRSGESSALWSGSAESEEAQNLLAEWDHLTNLELIRRLAALVRRTWREAQRDQEISRQRSSKTRGCLAGFLFALVTLAVLIVALFALRQFFQRFPAPAAPAPTSTVLVETPRDVEWYDIYFTSPRYPDDPVYHKGGMDERFIELVDSTRERIDIAIYDMDLMNVAESLLAAQERGVRVRLVVDADNADEPALAFLRQSGIPIIEDGRSSLMHNKFAVADGRSVWTGSWNFTEKDTHNYNNNVVLIESPELAKNYEDVFEEMFEDGEFGPRRPPRLQTRFVIQGVSVENYFSPEDEVAEKIVALLRDAQRRIEFMAFSFTRDDMGDAILERAQAGVEVRGVFENTGSQTRFSEYGRLREAGLDVRRDGNPFLMHHKVIIIDGRIVIFGSYNFSINADEDNDENVLIVDDDGFAAAFVSEFQKVYQQAEP